MTGESIHVILHEVFPDVPKVLKTDNMPALSILTGDGGSWRTRHLRLRTAYARQSVSAGEWTLQHVPGEFMVADIGTKPLTAARFLKVCMGMGKVKSKSEVGVEEGKERKEGEKKEEKKEQDGQLANKEKKRLAKTAQVLRLITLAASIAVTKAEEEAEEAFSFEVILIYTLAIIVLTLAVQRLPGMQQCGGLRSCDSVLWLNLEVAP